MNDIAIREQLWQKEAEKGIEQSREQEVERKKASRGPWEIPDGVVVKRGVSTLFERALLNDDIDKAGWLQDTYGLHFRDAKTYAERLCERNDVSIEAVEDVLKEKGSDYISEYQDAVVTAKIKKAQNKEAKNIRDVTDQIKDRILEQDGEPEQLLFSFMPTTLTRITPFFPMSRRDMKDRPYYSARNPLTFDNAWGRISVVGEKLSVGVDESVLLAINHLLNRHKSYTFQTSIYEICQIMGLTNTGPNYKKIWASIERLIGTVVKLEVWNPDVKPKKEPIQAMTSNIIVGASTGPTKTQITVNPYFHQTFSEGLTTKINLAFRASLRGDYSKALYRFFEGQRPNPYTINLLALARAINVNLEMPMGEIRKAIRKGLAELKKKKFIYRWMTTKTDMVKVWQGKHKTIEKPKDE